MDEYITKREVRAALLKRSWRPNDWYDIKVLISSIKPADVRLVVYCKDCDEAKIDTIDGAIYCPVWDYLGMPEKGFCHYGSSIMKDGD